MLKSKHKRKTVADKINDLIAKPGGDESSDSDDELTTAPRVVDFEDDYELPDARTTEFRKRNVKLLSQQSAKYRGKLALRKDFISDEENENSTDSSAEDESEDILTAGSVNDKEENISADSTYLEEEDVSTDSKDYVYETDEELYTDEESAPEDAASEFDESEEDYDDTAVPTDNDDASSEGADDNEDATEIVTEKNRQSEVRKGACVQNQLRVWEKLLDLRIQTQKLLTKANKLPVLSEMHTNKELDAISKESVENVSTLLNSLLKLQNALSSQTPEVKAALPHTLKRSLPMPTNDTPATKRFSTHLEERFKEFQTYRNTVLIKWDDRTKLLTPGAGAKKKSLNEDYDIIKKINNTLMNRSILILNSQTIKNNGNEQAEHSSESEQDTIADKTNPNIYDDSDFYHQQLRELIEYKSNTSASMKEITKQFEELQKLRQKMKKKVDTRASKGRKIRYVVHNKLINFMAPVDDTTWTDEAKDELYKSLFV